MDAETYQREAVRTLITDPGEISKEHQMILWCALGMAGETGETADNIKKAIYHHHGLDIPILEKEIGDIMWYVACLCETLGIRLSDVMKKNIDKLLVRYPEGFSYENSLKRADVKDKDRE